ncbi:N-acetylmuramoyl-L-alanine amidase [Cohaesibacter marisflavi]|uniref:1,6-anhydro-N-acetylmuramyl-L-alanine amidase AmpD n=1 Tax=Cohaesibacter marisflavi TaxID=655353 RepID=A0A1I5EGD5_9HYPH|nr:N-acetylmuramoyl-L-alanine amidase [Cohaesibacter marisflavi]SFO10423.1 N-acetylmuramoyl-L-alanine amidase [Cohaesibacter marisflavi]
MFDISPHSAYTIRNHMLCANEAPVPFERSPNQSGDFSPRGIILHDTAGRLEKGNAVNWFLKPEAKASAHLTIERDGSVTQQVAFNRRAWHAGKSCYRGEEGVNAFAFGIEMVNLGRCNKLRDGSIQPWFKGDYRDGTDGLHFAFAASRAHGKGWWLDYSAAQIRTVTAIAQSLIEKYQLSFIAGHWEIAPGRKIDPNPLFPLEPLRNALLGAKGEQGGPMVIADANLRRWPSYADNVIRVLEKGTPLTIIRSGHYKPLGHAELWHLVDAGDQQGWVNGTLIDLD